MIRLIGSLGLLVLWRVSLLLMQESGQSVFLFVCSFSVVLLIQDSIYKTSENVIVGLSWLHIVMLG